MSRSVNKVFLVGHLGRDAETRFTQGGVPVTNFAVATSRSWKDAQSGDWKEETDWHNVQLWRAENLAQYLLKGVQVHVEGRLQTRSTEKDGEKRYFTEIVAENVVLLGGRTGERPADGGGGSRGARDGVVSRPRTGANRPAGGGQQAGRSAQGGWDGVTDDDVPF